MHKYRHSFSRSFVRVASSIVAIASILLPALLVPPAHAQGPWEDLVNNVVGFGKNTTGGKGGALCQVTNLNNSGTGSLRACAEAVGAMWITFTVSGTINLTSDIYLKSNKTIDGRGQNIVVSKEGFILGRTQGLGNTTNNVIIHNISIKNVNLSNGMIKIMEDASNVWVDHVTFQNAIDEIIYISSDGADGGYNGVPPRAVTLSWNHFPAATPNAGWDDKSILVSDPLLPQDVSMTVTLHHNHYQTYVRHPLARFATIHAFNNYYNKTNIGVQPRSHAKFYSENEIFYRLSSYPMVKAVPDICPTCGDSTPPDNVKVLNPWLINGAVVQERNPSTIFKPSSFYSYTAETANAALQTKIINTAGWQSVALPTASPTVPTGLTAVASASQVSLSWNASSGSGVTGYRVYRNGTQIAAPASNSYIDGNLVPGTYSYTVAAVDAAGNVSAQSGSVSATVFRPPARLRLSLLLMVSPLPSQAQKAMGAAPLERHSRVVRQPPARDSERHDYA